jgi:hypothetical protein
MLVCGLDFTSRSYAAVTASSDVARSHCYSIAQVSVGQSVASDCRALFLSGQTGLSWSLDTWLAFKQYFLGHFTAPSVTDPGVE